MSSEYVQSCRSQEEERREDITLGCECRVASSAVPDIALERDYKKQGWNETDCRLIFPDAIWQ